MTTSAELSRREVVALIGSELTDTLIDLEHAFLNYGEHHRFAASTVIYNLAGIRELAKQFADRAEKEREAAELTEMTEEQEARIGALESAGVFLAEKVAEFEKAVATDPKAYTAEADRKQKEATPSRDLIPANYRSPYVDE